MYYDDLDYASKRLNGTLVRLKDGTPFQVNRMEYNGDSVMGAIGYALPAKKSVWQPLSNIDLTPVPLGFVNTELGMVFTCRKPMRKDWRQGLSLNSLVTYGAIPACDMSYTTLMQPILNTYPSFKTAVGTVVKRGSVAFSRDFGLVYHDGRIGLVYRKYVVGTVKDGVATLSDDKLFLQQHLDEVI